MREIRPHLLFAAVLLGAYLLLFAILAFGPVSRQDWLLENAIALVFVGGLAATARRFPFSRISYALIFVFLCLHTVGAHYTYSLVPYDEWMEAITGRTVSDLLGFERNHFDRMVHFLYGLLIAYPIRELVLRVADVRGFWGYFIPLDVTMSTSVVYELIEWAAAVVFGGDLGVAYVGAQGDPWDAQKDMALAALGAVVSMTVVAIVNMRIQRDFAREWGESLRVKRRAPLGEDRIREHLRDRGSDQRAK